MDDFNKRSAGIFGALDTLSPRQQTVKTESISVDGEFKRPCGIYTPPAKRQKQGTTTSQTPTINHTQSEYKGHQGAKQKYNHRDGHRYPLSRPHLKSRDGRQQGHTHRDPTKWTKYDLRDDGTDRMSGLSAEQINRTVAYQFLDQLKKQNHPEENDPSGDKDSKIVFKKPLRLGCNSDSDTTSQGSREAVKKGNKDREVVGMSSGGVRVMPEYVVGMGGRGRRKRTLALSGEETGSEEGGSGLDSGNTSKTKVRTKQSAVVLSHLDDECDD